jgi:predicted phosphate transport protein (TIGR00153 family)
MVRLRLTPQKREFYDLYCRAAANSQEIARLLLELIEGWPETRPLLAAIREAEHRGDRLTHDVISLLNSTFVTPFDRDDMYRLATVLDDICDHIDEAADEMDAYEVTDVPPRAVEQARTVYEAARHLYEAVQSLEGFRILPEQLMAVRDLENEGDRISREAVAELFRSGADPMTIIRWRDIHEQIEEANDACENAADVLEAILVRNR